jgi:hypothetical protein
MSRRHRYTHEILIIENTETTSNTSGTDVRNVIALTFYLPTALVGDATLEVSPNGTDWFAYAEDFGDGGSATTIEIGAFNYFRVVAGTQTSDVEIIVMAVEELT